MKDSKDSEILFTVYGTENGIEVRLGSAEIDALSLLGTLELLKKDIIDNMIRNTIPVNPESEPTAKVNRPKYDA